MIELWKKNITAKAKERSARENIEVEHTMGNFMNCLKTEHMLLQVR